MPTISTADGAASWGGANCASGASDVAVGTTCTITAASGFTCTDPGLCGADGNFAATGGCLVSAGEECHGHDSNPDCVSGYTCANSQGTAECASGEAGCSCVQDADAAAAQACLEDRTRSCTSPAVKDTSGNCAASACVAADFGDATTNCCMSVSDEEEKPAADNTAVLPYVAMGLGLLVALAAATATWRKTGRAGGGQILPKAPGGPMSKQPKPRDGPGTSKVQPVQPKRFRCFLSHFKREAAAEARILHTSLETHLGKGKVFLDSDCLHDLRLLMRHLKHSDVIVVMQTAGIFTRSVDTEKGFARTHDGWAAAWGIRRALSLERPRSEGLSRGLVCVCVCVCGLC